MSFRLITVLWFFALAASAMAVFGPVTGGTLAIATPLAPRLWLAIKSWKERAVVFVVLLVLIGLLMEPVSIGGSTARQSRHNLKQWVLAMHKYHDDHSTLPPACSVDGAGNALHSWRTLLLPYAEQASLARLVNLSEPWDSRANRAVMEDVAIDTLSNPRVPRAVTMPDETQYVGVVGDEAVLVPGGEVTFRDINDGTSNTIVLIEVVRSGIAWHEPRDLTIDEAAALLCGETLEGEPITEVVPSGYFTSRRVRGDELRNRCVALADGSCSFIGLFGDRSSARVFLTRAGGEKRQPLPETHYLEDYTIEHIVHWGRVWGVVVFVAIALMPAVQYVRRTVLSGLPANDAKARE